jgi:hypothetical protein
MRNCKFLYFFYLSVFLVLHLARLFFFSKFLCTPCEIPILFYITVIFAISMSDSVIIYPSVSLSCESPYSARSVSLLRSYQLPHLFSVFLCPLPSVLSIRLSQFAASSCCFSLECPYVFLFPSLLTSHSFSPGLYVHFSPYHLFPLLFCLHLPNTSSFSFFVHLSHSASLFSENRCDKLTLELFTCQAND